MDKEKLASGLMSARMEGVVKKHGHSRNRWNSSMAPGV